MAVTREQKKEILASLKDSFSNAGSVVFVNFHGLNVTESEEMRSSLREKEVGYKVAKKTLIKRALDEAKYEGEMPELEGELALAYGEDILSPAGGVYEFQKKFDGKIKIIGGVFEGVYKNAEEMTAIAQIPSRETLYAQFVNLINSPIQGFVMAVNAIADEKQEA